MELKFIFIAIFYCLSYYCIGQINYKPFKDCTYFIVSQPIGTQKIVGSGFFIKKGKNLFLVTAAHVVTPWDDMKNKMYDDIPDTFYIRMRNIKTNSVEWVYLDDRSAKSDTNRYHYFEKPDIFPFKVKEFKGYEINTINKYLDYHLPKELAQPDSMFVYGFATTSNDYYELLTHEPILAKGHIKGDIRDKNQWLHANGYDKINYIATINYYTSSIKGVSGSPVFLQYKSKISFGGVAFGGADSSLFIVRPEYVLSAIRRNK